FSIPNILYLSLHLRFPFCPKQTDTYPYESISIKMTVKKIFNRLVGINTFQENSINWSPRIRGNVKRIHMRTKTTRENFKTNQMTPGIKPRKGTGCQPPKNKMVVIAAMANI